MHACRQAKFVEWVEEGDGFGAGDVFEAILQDFSKFSWPCRPVYEG